MSYHFVFPVLFTMGLPAFAQNNMDQQELKVAVRACEEDKVCLFGLIERQFEYDMTDEQLASPWLLIGILFGGIDASVQAESLSQKRDILDRAIRLVDEYLAIPFVGELFNDTGGLAFPSSPFHLLRAEVCMKAADDACFLESAALLLEREIAWREKRIKFARFHANTRDGNMDYLLPPIRWSDIRDIGHDHRTDGKPKFDWGDVDSLLAKAGLGDTDTRIDAILSEYELREWGSNE